MKKFSKTRIAILDCVGKQRLINYDDDTITELTHKGACDLLVLKLSSSHVLAH